MSIRTIGRAVGMGFRKALENPPLPKPKFERIWEHPHAKDDSYVSKFFGHERGKGHSGLKSKDDAEIFLNLAKSDPHYRFKVTSNLFVGGDLESTFEYARRSTYIQVAHKDKDVALNDVRQDSGDTGTGTIYVKTGSDVMLTAIDKVSNAEEYVEKLAAYKRPSLIERTGKFVQTVKEVFQNGSEII